MSRISRKLLEGKICHNIVQGINKEYIFEKEENKNKYFNLMKKYYLKYKIDIISYCIMDNHTHLILYSDEIKNISSFMKQINSIYAFYYNKKYDRVGYVFRNRFKSILLLTREQLCRCIKYIHMNPVKANIVKVESEYKYSSYNDYIKKTGFLNQKILDFLFVNPKNYIEEFKSIPYKDIYDNTINIREILEKYFENEKITLEQLKKDKKLLQNFLEYINFNNYKFSKQELAYVLGVSRATIYRRIRRKNKNENN